MSNISHPGPSARQEIKILLIYCENKKHVDMCSNVESITHQLHHDKYNTINQLNARTKADLVGLIRALTWYDEHVMDHRMNCHLW